MNGFKQTEIGLIPEDWEVVRLGEILFPNRKKLKFREYDGSIPIVEKIQFDTGKIIFRNKNQTKTDLYIGERGRLLTSKINFHQGAVAIINNYEKIAATTHYEIYKTNENQANIKYLWYYFRSKFFKKILYDEIKFAGFKKEANYEFIKNLQIPLPPLEEQQKIAKVLDKIQQAIEIQDRIIEETKNLKKSLMQKLFTEGLYGEEQKETEIGLIPKSWEVVRLGDVAEIKLGRTPERKEKKYWENGDIPWVKIQDLNNGIIYDTSEKISQLAFREVFRKIFIPKGTLLFSFKLTIGKVGILGIDAVHHEGIASLFPNKERVNKEYLFYLFQNLNYEEYLDTYVKGKTLNKEKLNNLPIPLPPLEEQKEIAHILSTVDKKIEIEQKKKELLKELFKTMLHKLMSGEIRLRDVEI